MSFTMSRRRVLTALAGSTMAMPNIAKAASKKIRIGHNNTRTSGVHAASVAFQKYVQEKSSGRIDVEIYSDSQLGNDEQLVKAVSEGTLDMTVSGLSVLSGLFSDIGLGELPYMFKDTAAARTAYDGALGAYFRDGLAKSNMVMIGWAESGVRHVTANKPIRKVEDLKDLKIRVQPAKVQLETFLGLGAKAEAIGFTALPEALRTGRVEAQENPIGIVLANEFLLKSQSHFSLTGHVYSPFAVAFSSDVLEELSEEDRGIVRGGGKAAVQATRDLSDELFTSGVEKLKAQGMTIVTDVDRPGFQKAVDGMTDRIAQVVGADALKRVRGLIA